MKTISTTQSLNFELMRQASFNKFNGEEVVHDLLSNPDFWEGAVMDRAGYVNLDEANSSKWQMAIDLIKLRDIADGWNVDTLFITPKKGYERNLEELARGWRADEVGWIGGEEACKFLGSSGPELRQNEKQILKLWWD